MRRMIRKIRAIRCLFDLLFRGLEVTTGGQRIHDYDTQVKKLIKKGMNPEDFAGYLMIHQYGQPARRFGTGT